MSSLLAAELALLACALEFAITCGWDLGLPARQHLVRRDESDAAHAARSGDRQGQECRAAEQL